MFCNRQPPRLEWLAATHCLKNATVLFSDTTAFITTDATPAPCPMHGLRAYPGDTYHGRAVRAAYGPRKGFYPPSSRRRDRLLFLRPTADTGG